MFSNFYNESLRKYIVIFGTLFNNIVISRVDNDDTEIQEFKVPISFGPKQKFLAMVNEDPNKDRPQAISFPRISFEIVSMNYDGQRRTNGVFGKQTTSTSGKKFSPVPYDIEFEMNIYTKGIEDGYRIIEQIVPIFRPEFIPTAYLIDDYDPVDIPIILNSVTPQDIYEGSFEERRVSMWTLTFTVKALFFGPVLNKKIIKVANVHMFTSITANTEVERINIQPGLDANGNPTTNSAISIDPLLINFEDNWGYVVDIESV